MTTAAASSQGTPLTPGMIVIPGPEILVIFGVHVPVLAAIFGLVGIGLGHMVAPTPSIPLGWRRSVAVIAAGALTSLAIVIATGQRPLVVLAWSFGIGFSGIAIFQTVGEQVRNAARMLGDMMISRIAGGAGTTKEKGQ